MVNQNYNLILARDWLSQPNLNTNRTVYALCLRLDNWIEQLTCHAGVSKQFSSYALAAVAYLREYTVDFLYYQKWGKITECWLAKTESIFS